MDNDPTKDEFVRIMERMRLAEENMEELADRAWDKFGIGSSVEVNQQFVENENAEKRGWRLVRTKNRKGVLLVDIETKETLAEGFTPFIQGYADGILDGDGWNCWKQNSETEIGEIMANTYEIEKRDGSVETIIADSVSKERLKVSFYIHHARKPTVLESLAYIDDEPPETVTERELIAEYTLSQIVGWKKS